MSENDLKILGAVAAAVAAIIVAVLSAALGFVSTRANQRDLEHLKARLTEDKGESDARRAYTYEALKRLYAQYEPIRFHLIESVEAAQRTIGDLAMLANAGTLESEGVYPQGSYLRAARVYHLLAPAAHFKIMQSRLTLIDLGASKSSYLQYLLAKEACVTLACDREIAREFKLAYTPYVQGWRELRQENPARYRRQGFAFGRYDNAVCALVAKGDDGSQRVLSFGDFEVLAKDVERADYNSPLGAALDLFDDFRPDSRPVLWRAVLIQSCLYQLLLYAARSGATSLEAVVAHIPNVEARLMTLGVPPELVQQTIAVVKAGPLAAIRASHGDA